MTIVEVLSKLASQLESMTKKILLRKLMENINQHLDLALDCLSMGMTNDLEAAVAEGATHVRIGTAIFGPRRQK